MKKWITNFSCIGIAVILFAILMVMFISNQKTYNSLPTDTGKSVLPSNPIQYNEYRLSTKICKTVFGMDPETFVNKQGKDTLLENGYTNAWVTSDQVLVLQLTDTQLDSWRNSDMSLQILQKILGEEKEIVTEIIPPTDHPLWETLYGGAETCKYEIAEDYSKIVVGPGQDRSFRLVIPQACLMMQLLEGIPSDEMSVEYLEMNSIGQITDHEFYPIYVYMFQEIEECENLIHYEQIDSTITRYHDANIDPNIKGFEYKSFFGMYYQSDNMEFEIFAYEFTNKENAFTYYAIVNEDEYISLEKEATFTKVHGQNNYEIIVARSNKVYKLTTSNLMIDQIDKMLSTVFSIKIKS